MVARGVLGKHAAGTMPYHRQPHTSFTQQKTNIFAQWRIIRPSLAEVDVAYKRK